MTSGTVSLVPVQSVFNDNGSDYVWVIPEQKGHPSRQQVTIGVLYNSEIEVQGDLEPQARVAVAGVHTLHEEMIVRPMLEDGEGLDG